jgi:hypothetical protein
MLDGQIKKLLYEEIRTKFPPPFDYKNPNFASGVDCTFCVYQSGLNTHWKEKETQIIKSGEFYKKLGGLLVGKGFELLSYSAPEKKSDAMEFRVKIKKEIICSDYYDFENELREFFIENQLRDVLIRDKALLEDN